MGGISGAGFDRMLFPSTFGPEDRQARAGGREAAQAAGLPRSRQAQTGAAAGRDFRRDTALQRIMAQQQQAQGYGQLLQQLAKLGAFLHSSRNQPQQQAPVQGAGAFRPFFFGENASASSQGQAIPRGLPITPGTEPSEGQPLAPIPGGEWVMEQSLMSNPPIFVWRNTRTGEVRQLRQPAGPTTFREPF